MKKKSQQKESKSLKTFSFYTMAVCGVIVIALGMKAVMVIRASVFDGAHQFIIAIAKRGQVREIIACDPSANSSSFLSVNNHSVSLAGLSKQLGIVPDGTIDADYDPPANADIAGTLLSFLLHYNFIHTHLTVYDLGRLILDAKNVPVGNREVDAIGVPIDQKNSDEKMSKLFADTMISQENLSLQVINATETSGLGLRLERVLSNMGGNVVSITTSYSNERHSKIEYFGKESYTLNKLKKLFDFPVEKLQSQTIANIVIIIGADSKNTSLF